MKQPKLLYLLNFVSMWECFSYYGMRVLLVFFLIHELHYSDHSAFVLFALYTALVEVGGIAGGLIADRWLGLKTSVIIGGWMIAIGHACMAFPHSQSAFFAGLGFIVVGTGLFRSNAAMLLGRHYEENDPRREPGYTLYYTGINVGGFLATLCCGYVGETYGWHAGFSLAGLGMLAGNIALFLGGSLIKENGAPRHSSSYPLKIIQYGVIAIAPFAAAAALHQYNWASLIVPWLAVAGFGYVFLQIRQWAPEERKKGYQLAFYIVCLAIYYGCEEQLGSSLLLFSERHVDRETWFGTLPPSSLIIMNPLTILIVGPLLSKLWRSVRIDTNSMIGISFLLLGGAFYLLSYGSGEAAEGEQVTLALCLGSFVCIGFGELFIAPVIYAYASKIAPKNYEGMVMGMVTMGYATANILSGWISRFMAMNVAEGSHAGEYGEVFGWIACFTLGWGGSLLLINRVLDFKESADIGQQHQEALS